MKKASDRYFTVKQAAAILGWSDMGIRKAIMEDRLRAEKIGKMGYLILKKDFHVFKQQKKKIL